MMKCSSGVLVKTHDLIVMTGPAAVGKVPCSEFPQDRFVGIVGLAIPIVRIDLLVAMVVPPDLEPGYAKDREPVVAAFIDGQVEDREDARLEHIGFIRLEPGQHLTLGLHELDISGINCPAQPPALTINCSAS